MLARQAIQARLGATPELDHHVGRASLPYALKPDHAGIRLGMFRRLSASRLFALGDRAGVLRAAQSRSGRPYRLDTRQQVIVKAYVSRHVGSGAARGAALAAHIGYLGRLGAGIDGSRPEFFDISSDQIDAAGMSAGWGTDRHHFRFIISPEHGDRIADLRRFTRETLRRVGEDLGEPALEWIATCHHDTDQPHAHVLIRGRRSSGRDLIMPRSYIGYGFRARAQEVAHELLGDLSRTEAERRIWRETQADRFTGFDQRLLQAADANLEVEDGVGGTDAWSALLRGRLRHLEALGLATRRGHRFRLHDDLERDLRALQLRRDVIRTLQQRRLDIGRQPAELGDAPVKGRVVKAGHFDELGGSSWVVIRDGQGQEHFARLRFGQSAPGIGRSIELVPTPQGVQLRGPSRSSDLGR